MKIGLTFLPLLTIIVGVLIYRFNGRKELMKMDLVQFIYAFVLTPTVLIWIKIVMYYNLGSQLGLAIDPEDRFMIDTAYTAFAFFFFGFMVIHSLTKTFEIKMKKDPLFDIFEHSEYFHMWLSHVVTYSFGLLIVLVFGFLNIFFPLAQFLLRSYLYIALIFGFVMSIIFYKTALGWYNGAPDRKKYERVISIQVYIYTFILLAGYIVMRPHYSAQYLVFWSAAIFYVCEALLSQNLKRNRKKYLEKMHHNSLNKVAKVN